MKKARGLALQGFLMLGYFALAHAGLVLSRAWIFNAEG